MIKIKTPLTKNLGRTVYFVGLTEYGQNIYIDKVTIHTIEEHISLIDFDKKCKKKGRYYWFRVLDEHNNVIDAYHRNLFETKEQAMKIFKKEFEYYYSNKMESINRDYIRTKKYAAGLK